MRVTKEKKTRKSESGRSRRIAGAKDDAHVRRLPGNLRPTRRSLRTNNRRSPTITNEAPSSLLLRRSIKGRREVGLYCRWFFANEPLPSTRSVRATGWRTRRLPSGSGARQARLSARQAEIDPSPFTQKPTPLKLLSWSRTPSR